MWAHGADGAHGAHGALAQVGYVKGLDHDNGGQGSIARHRHKEHVGCGTLDSGRVMQHGARTREAFWVRLEQGHGRPKGESSSVLHDT